MRAGGTKVEEEVPVCAMLFKKESAQGAVDADSHMREQEAEEVRTSTNFG